MSTAKRLVVLRSLQAFEAVARRGSVAAAASELGVSPGAVSQQLRKIEQALGACLLERKGKGLELTTWGRLYQADIAPAFEQLRQAQQRLWAARTHGRLVLSCLSSVASRWIGPRLFDWQAAHPTAKVRLVGAEAEPALGADTVDFRVTYGDAVQRYAHHAELFTDVAVPACAPSLLQAHGYGHARGVVTPSQLLTLPLIGIDWDPGHGAPPQWSAWAASLGLAHIVPQAALGFSLSSLALDAAVNGHGVVLAQRSLIGDDLATGRLVVLLDHGLPLAHGYHLAWDRASLDKPDGIAFRDWIIAIARQQALDLSRPTLKQRRLAPPRVGAARRRTDA